MSGLEEYGLFRERKGLEQAHQENIDNIAKSVENGNITLDEAIKMLIVTLGMTEEKAKQTLTEKLNTISA